MKTIFSQEFKKDPTVIMYLTLEYVGEKEPKPKGHPNHIDMKKGDRCKVSFTPPHTRINFYELSPPYNHRGKISMFDSDLGKPIYKLISIDKIKIIK